MTPITKADTPEALRWPQPGSSHGDRIMRTAARMQMDYLETLETRGYIHQVSNEGGLREALAAGVVTAYVGYDCTGPSLHIGHLISIMMLRLLQQSGHRPLVLLGGGTTKVGDPSGKDETRKILTQKEIEANKTSIKSVFERFLTFDEEGNGAILADNDEWLKNLRYIKFLREYGRHFTINRMLTFDSVKLRLEREQPLTFLEFNYMLLQAYDFVELARRHGCRLQVGGSDQWGNIINGIELARRTDGIELFALTTPLLTTASGAKMGKTAKGAVWLNADKMSAYDYWQFWRNTEDADTGRFLKLFTELPLDEIARLERLSGVDINDAKKVLATEATALLHGREAAQAAADTARQAFEEGVSAEGLPMVPVPQAELAAGLGILRAFALAGLVASTSDARRQIKGGALKLNDLTVTDEKASLTLDDVQQDGAIKLSMGKKRHVLLRPCA